MRNRIKYLIVSFFSLFRVKNIILLESIPDFTDSSKVFFDYLIDNKINDNYKIYWFIDNRNKFNNFKYHNVFFVNAFGNRLINKLKMIHLSKKAKFIFVCNRHIVKLNKKTKYIYFTHGIPLKYIKNIKMVSKDIDYIISPGKYWENIFADQFNVSKNKVLPLGQPRYDIIFNKQSNINIDFIEKKFSKIIVWLPTFRQHKNKQRDDTKISLPYGLPTIYSKTDLEKVNDYLIKNNALLILKLHPAQDTLLIKEFNSKNIVTINDDDLFRNNIILSNLIHRCDVLITDYSSVLYEGMILDKKLIYAIDDFDNYKKNRGFMCDNPEFYMIGNKVKNVIELLNAFDNSFFKEDKYKKLMEERCKLFFDYHDNLSSKRICEFFKIK